MQVVDAEQSMQPTEQFMHYSVRSSKPCPRGHCSPYRPVSSLGKHDPVNSSKLHPALQLVQFVGDPEHAKHVGSQSRQIPVEGSLYCPDLSQRLGMQVPFESVKPESHEVQLSREVQLRHFLEHF